MIANGLQKLTLLDFPGRVACTIFFAGCNFRCPFCHNGSLVLRPAAAEQIAEETILSFLRKRQGVLDGVCLTGGEPLLQPELPAFLEKIRALGYAIKLDTNGSQPDALRALVEAGLVDYVAMDVKNAPERYGETIGLPDYDLAPVLESMAYLRSGAVAHEFRTTVVRGLHTAEDMAALGQWLAGEERYFLQRFVDSGDVLAPGMESFSPAEMREFLALVQKSVPNAALRGVD